MDLILVVIQFTQVYLSPLMADDAFKHNRIYRKRLLCHAVKYMIIVADGASKLSINLFIYESGPNDEKIEDVLFMQIQILNLFMGTKKHTSFEDYREDVSKLSKMAEQVEFTIIREAIKYGRLELQKRIDV